MISARASVCMAIGMALLGLQVSCGKKAGVSADDTLEWFLGCHETPNFEANDPQVLLCIAQFEADANARGTFLEMLQKARKGDPRSLGAAALAGFLHDQESAEILKLLLLEADDSLRWQAAFALWKRHEWLAVESVLAVLKRSADDKVRSTAVGLAVSEWVDLSLYEAALNDPAVGVRHAAFSRAPANWSMRRLAKEWLRQRVANVALQNIPERTEDVETCLIYLEGAYGLEHTADLMRGAWTDWAKRLLVLADDIDAATSQAVARMQSSEATLPNSPSAGTAKGEGHGVRQ